MKTRLLAVLTIHVLFFLVSTNAQTGSEACKLILQNGLYKHFDFKKTSNFNQDVRTYFESDTFKQDLRNGKWEGTLSVVIDGVPLGIGAGASDSEINTFQQKVKSATSFSVTESFYESAQVAVPDVEIARAYTECLERTAEYGFRVIPTVNDRDVIFIVTYRKQNSVDRMPKVVLFDVKNGTNVQKPFKVGDELQDSNAITADRDPEKDLSLILQTDKGSVVYRVPAESVGYNKDIPVGTIVVSYLNWTQFESITQNNSANPAGPFWSSRYSKWAPADGRSVPLSKFVTATSRPDVPDLRGVFLRGLNFFSSDQPYAVKPEQADPDSRTLGSFQQEAFKKHNHGGRTGNDSPDHSHERNGYPFKVDYGNDNYTQNQDTPKNGYGRQTDGANTRHQHPIDFEGGNETRPKNVAIYYYIRIN